jgi:restriction endonuclease S subunit
MQLQRVPTELDGAICSTGFEVLRAVEVEPDWLFLVVKSRPFIEEMASLVQGALYPAVRPADIRAYKFALPPLAEQQRIVAKIDALQERSRRAREALILSLRSRGTHWRTPDGKTRKTQAALLLFCHKT